MKAKTFETQRLIKRLKEARKAVETKKTETKADADGEAEDMDMSKPAYKKKQDLTEEDVAKFEHELELVKVLFLVWWNCRGKPYMIRSKRMRNASIYRRR